MSDPRRLSEDGGSDFELSLLRSARSDAPPAGSRKKALVALGLAGTAGAAVTATTATSTAGTLIKSTASLGLLKWIGVGVVGGIVTVTAVSVTVHPSSAPTSTASTATTAHAPEARNAAPSQPRTPATQAPEPDPTPQAAPDAPEPIAAAGAPAEAVTTGPARATKPAAQSASSSLAEELATIDAARVALLSHDSARALRLLDDHDRKFPRGALGLEASVLRIEALAARGDRATAVRLGKAFLEAHPNSPYSAQIRAIAGTAEPSAPGSAP